MTRIVMAVGENIELRDVNAADVARMSARATNAGVLLEVSTGAWINPAHVVGVYQVGNE